MCIWIHICRSPLKLNVQNIYIYELKYAYRNLDCDTFIFFQLPPVHQPKPVITPRWIIPTTAVSFFVFLHVIWPV